MGLFGSLLGGVASFIPGGGLVKSALGALPGLLGAAGAIGGAKKQGQASKLQQQAIDMQMGEYNKNAPLRDKARQLALGGIPQRPHLGSLFSDAGNPYNKAGEGISALYNGGAPPLPQAAPMGPPPIAPQPMAPPQGLAGFLGGPGNSSLPGLAQRLFHPPQPGGLR